MQLMIKKILVLRNYQRLYGIFFHTITLHIPRAATFNLWPTKDYEICFFAIYSLKKSQKISIWLW